MKKTVAITMFAAAAALCATSAMAAKDNFNRSDLGKKWVVPSGRLYISNDQLQGDDLSIGYDKKSSGDSKASATLTINSTSDTEYGAVAIGDIASGNNIFVKIQSQSGDGKFDTAGFYVGNNGGGDFFTLDSEVPSPAQLTVSLCGTVAKMLIKSSAGKQVYTYDYGASFPSGGGLGTYGSISLDNYKSTGGKCDLAGQATVIKHSTAKDLTLAK